MNRVEYIIAAVVLVACLALPASGQQKPKPITLFTADNKLGSVSAELNASDDAWLLQCRRYTRTCELIEVSLLPKTPPQLIHINAPIVFTILQWDADGLVAQSDEAICVTDRLLINFSDKSVTLLKSPKKPTDKPLGDACKAAKSEAIKMLENEKEPKP